MRRNISVDEAIAAVTAAAPEVRTEIVSLAAATGRVLAEGVSATRDQPPFAASAMDGYAVAEREAGSLRIIGESIAGRGFHGSVGAGEAVRIFTGAPVPHGASAVIMQEKVARDGDLVTLSPEALASTRTFVRPAGIDFRAGDVLLEVGDRLDAWRLSLAAAAGRDTMNVAARPRIAILTNGDELVEAGVAPRPDQIFESASFAVADLAESWGGEVRRLPRAADSADAILASLEGVDADLIVTIGGASVGDHDLIKPALAQLGLVIDFASVNVRPGRPAWFGQLADGRHVLGLPGNPASAMVCAELFLKALIVTALGGRTPPPVRAVLTTDTPGDGPREAYLRAHLTIGDDGVARITAFSEQDSSLVTVFASANALVRVPAGAVTLRAGDTVEVRPLARL